MAFILFSLSCVYLCSLLPCNFIGWVLVLHFYIQGFSPSSSFIFFQYIIWQKMIMNFHQWGGGLYVFLSICKKVMKIFIHPSTWGLWGCFQIFKQKAMSGNQFKDMDYQKSLWYSHSLVISSNQCPLVGYLVPDA